MIHQKYYDGRYNELGKRLDMRITPVNDTFRWELFEYDKLAVSGNSDSLFKAKLIAVQKTRFIAFENLEHNSDRILDLIAREEWDQVEPALTI